MMKLVGTVLLVGLLGCSSTVTIDEDASARDIFIQAVRLKEDRSYEKALELFAKVRDEFPYSSDSIEARLEMADIHFQQQEYEVARSFYQRFKGLYPNHRSDYVMYRLALSYYYPLPRAIDRDLSLARQAVSRFKDFLSTHSQSVFTKDAQQKLQEVQEKLLRQELYIANFYFVRKMYESALLRYSQIIEDFPSSSLLSEAFLKGGISAAQLGQESKSRSYLDTLRKKFPGAFKKQKPQKLKGGR